MQNYVTAQFADAPREFRLTIEAIARLETRCSAGVGAIWQRLVGLQFYQSDVWETIRFGLIGAGVPETEANALVSVVAEKRSAIIGRYHQLASDILTAHMTGLDQAALASERLQMDDPEAGKKKPEEGDLILPPDPAT